MKALRFLLWGKTAFFKQPDVNTYVYYSYGCIHRVALLGIFGAIMGYGGYNSQSPKMDYPEFYEKLKHIQLAICPQNEKGYIQKKVQCFNNSVGYASQEAGGNLIVKEQWLENPKWEIVILVQDPVSEKLAERILNSRFEFIPYLGKNDHPANITESEMVELDAGAASACDTVVSVFSETLGNLAQISGAQAAMRQKSAPFKFKERLPVALEPICNQYVTESMIFTNQKVCFEDTATVYHLGEKNYVFI